MAQGCIVYSFEVTVTAWELKLIAIALCERMGNLLKVFSYTQECFMNKFIVDEKV